MVSNYDWKANNKVVDVQRARNLIRDYNPSLQTSSPGEIQLWAQDSLGVIISDDGVRDKRRMDAGEQSNQAFMTPHRFSVRVKLFFGEDISPYELLKAQEVTPSKEVVGNALQNRMSPDVHYPGLTEQYIEEISQQKPDSVVRRLDLIYGIQPEQLAECPGATANYTSIVEARVLLTGESREEASKSVNNEGIKEDGIHAVHGNDFLTNGDLLSYITKWREDGSAPLPAIEQVLGRPQEPEPEPLRIEQVRGRIATPDIAPTPQYTPDLLAVDHRILRDRLKDEGFVFSDPEFDAYIHESQMVIFGDSLYQSVGFPESGSLENHGIHKSHLDELVKGYVESHKPLPVSSIPSIPLETFGPKPRGPVEIKPRSVSKPKIQGEERVMIPAVQESDVYTPAPKLSELVTEAVEQGGYARAKTEFEQEIIGLREELNRSTTQLVDLETYQREAARVPGLTLQLEELAEINTEKEKTIGRKNWALAAYRSLNVSVRTALFTLAGSAVAFVGAQIHNDFSYNALVRESTESSAELIQHYESDRERSAIDILNLENRNGELTTELGTTKKSLAEEERRAEKAEKVVQGLYDLALERDRKIQSLNIQLETFKGTDEAREKLSGKVATLETELQTVRDQYQTQSAQLKASKESYKLSVAERDLLKIDNEDLTSANDVLISAFDVDTELIEGYELDLANANGLLQEAEVLDKVQEEDIDDLTLLVRGLESDITKKDFAFGAQQELFDSTVTSWTQKYQLLEGGVAKLKQDLKDAHKATLDETASCEEDRNKLERMRLRWRDEQRQTTPEAPHVPQKTRPIDI
ncbi:hypothetical protein HOL21_01055 [Candidatus Woesearchaeota archaeon]|nr:hypothetical protein [Candidatus Woesearchaeota archaeon]MBT5396783.1 hypothetical protein [Candidatus Woesearchaeota archaeon]MBT6367671.1 hypothetical protein [Candidatus Woesearchaeota archaeon]MBT7762928.1 hypothetical protein [Candidatus Woesearchaeota archaeon]